MYEISVFGSTIAQQENPRAALLRAGFISLYIYPRRLVRVHDVDGVTVIAELRDGRLTPLD